eukprot:Rhum_TRINITY_DN14024_c0_g1::Rhum_TRINITY_DN14024_c0_g1_i1::g.67637::m.67637/K08887/ABL2; abelson tyrosine-protein kinase 2
MRPNMLRATLGLLSVEMCIATFAPHTFAPPSPATPMGTVTSIVFLLCITACCAACAFGFFRNRRGKVTTVFANGTNPAHSTSTPSGHVDVPPLIDSVNMATQQSSYTPYAPPHNYQTPSVYPSYATALHQAPPAHPASTPMHNHAYAYPQNPYPYAQQNPYPSHGSEPAAPNAFGYQPPQLTVQPGQSASDSAKKPPTPAPSESSPTAMRAIAYEQLKFKHKIGSGNSSHVYLATWRGADVAVKEVAYSDDVFREVQTQKRVSHPHIVQCHGYAVNGEKLYVVMEYCEGGCLKTLLEEKRRQGTPITVEELLRIAKHVSLAMSSMHADGWVHRDIAARNIFKKDETYKLGDFGLVREVDSTGSYKVMQGESGGVPVNWTSPEALSRNLCTKPGDVWSFGVLLWEVLVYCSRRPYGDKNLPQIEQRIVSGETLPLPDGCPPMLWDSLIARCFFSPFERPTFAKIVDDIIPALIAAASQAPAEMELDDDNPYREVGGGVYGPVGELRMTDELPFEACPEAESASIAS